MKVRVAALVVVALAASMVPLLATGAGAQSTSTNCPSSVEQVAVKQKVAQRVIARAHLETKAARKYTVGFVVPPSLGGSTKIANLTAVLRTDQAARDAAAASAASLVCQGLVDKQVAADAFRKDWRTSAQVLQQAADQRKADVAAFAKAEEQRQLDEYLASIPTTTTAPPGGASSSGSFASNFAPGTRCKVPGQRFGSGIVCTAMPDGTNQWQSG